MIFLNDRFGDIGSGEPMNRRSRAFIRKALEEDDRIAQSFIRMEWLTVKKIKGEMNRG